MAIGTPTLATPAVGATATSVATASFTPTVGNLLLAFAAARAAAAEIPTISDTLGNAWTQVDTSGTDFGNVAGRLWYQVVEGSPAARTVTASSTGATQVGLAIVSISGAGTDFSNFQIGTNGAGDPSVTMSAYAASSIALGFYAGNAGGSNPTVPAGYTSLTNSQIATNIRFAVAHDTTSPGTSMAWVGPSTDSLCFGVEIKEAAAGGGAVNGTLAAAESGSDTFAGSGRVALSGALVATETGIDGLSASGAVSVSGALSVSETLSDAAALSGSVLIAGVFSGQEAGIDSLSAFGNVPISGAFAAAENGSDTAAFSGAPAITGVLEGAEQGADTAEMAGSVTSAGINGGLATIETGSDAGSFGGGVLIAGSMAGTEANDNFAATGLVLVTGVMTAVEASADAFAAISIVPETPPDRTLTVSGPSRTAVSAEDDRAVSVYARTRQVAA
ncbi:hypothetical protein GOD68_18240 [Sinorhizobium medicae]|nr:hypothetical protein [Sinorhizobium medicae]